MNELARNLRDQPSPILTLLQSEDINDLIAQNGMEAFS